MVDLQAEESVALDPQSVAAGISPDQLNQPQAPNTSNEEALLRQKVSLANKHTKDAERKAAEADKRAAELEQQFRALSEQVQQTNTASLSEQGKFKELWEQSQKTIAGLKTELSEALSAKESVAQDAANERLKNQAVALIDSAGALSPDQTFTLLQAQHGLRRGEDGNVEVIVAGAAINLADHLASLRSGNSGWEHHFSASNSRGMGASPSSTAAPGQNNPWRRESYNFTEQMMLKSQNPELAAILQAEAGRS
jgi:hypothetical protein